MQSEVDARTGTGIKQLVQGRGLEAARGAGVQVQAGRQFIQCAEHRRGAAVVDAAAVVTVAQVTVADVHIQRSTAQPGSQHPLAALPFGLHIRIEAGQFILLVAAQLAAHAELLAHKILEALARILRARVLEADRGAQGAAGELAHVAPVQVDAVEVAVEVDHAARMRGRRLEAAREGLVLDHLTVAAVGSQLQAVGAEALLPLQADLLVVDALAGVVALGEGALRRLRVAGIDLAGARVALEGRPGDAKRVLGVALVQGVGDDGDLAVARGRDGQLGVALFARGGAVRPVAVGLEARRIQDIADPARLALRIQVKLAHAVAAGRAAELDGRRTLAVAGEELHDTARVIAVQGREWAAQHFDAFGHVEIEGGGLALAVGHGRRNAVRNQANAAHAEGRARAEAARGDLQVLRIVLPVLHHDARNGGERFGQIDAWLGVADARGVDDVDRGRQIEAGLLRAAAGHDHHLQRILRLRLGLRLGQCRGGEGGQQCGKQFEAGGVDGHCSSYLLMSPTS